MHIVTYMVCGKHKSRSTFRISEEDGKTSSELDSLGPSPEQESKAKTEDKSRRGRTRFIVGLLFTNTTPLAG